MSILPPTDEMIRAYQASDLIACRFENASKILVRRGDNDLNALRRFDIHFRTDVSHA